MTGLPLSKLDQELEGMLSSGDTIDCMDFTLLDLIPKRPTKLLPSSTFILQLDVNSVSTFGRVNKLLQESLVEVLLIKIIVLSPRQ